MVQGVKIDQGHILNVDPATGELIERVKVSTKQEVDAAVAAARKIQPTWAAVPLEERAALVRSAVPLIGRDKAALAKLITREMGKTLAESEAEVDENAFDKDEYCDLVRAANEPEIHGCSVIHRHAHGVVSICAPWNYPIEEIVLLAIPSLIAGNAIVIKPSEVVPLSSGTAATAFIDGLRAYPGLVGLVQGDGEVGSYLVSHPGVDMCAFTGSTLTGTKILAAASASLKPVVLECGGKDPMVVMADADLEGAARDAVDFSLANCGQVCCAVERVYVAASVAPAFEAKVRQHAQTYVAANGLQPTAEGTNQIGPMVSAMQRETVHRHVEAAKAAGARCILGGLMPPTKEKGTFYPPTVLADVPHAAEITREETFGPVVALSTFDGTDEAAVKLANDSTYGLTASVYSGDLARAGKIASRISAGQVGINNNALSGHRDVRSPFVGHKKSGYGSHSGTDGWRQFSVPRTFIYKQAPSASVLPMAPPSAPDGAAASTAKLVALALGSAAAGAAAAMLMARMRK